MRYADDSNGKSPLDASHYAGMLVVLAIIGLVAIRYIMEP
jgi:hypothetical protein